jgi:hypothetical protein
VKNIAKELFQVMEDRTLRQVPPREREKEFASLGSAG